jgi:hypothetical protein
VLTDSNSDEDLKQGFLQDPQYALAYAGLSDCYAIISAEIFGTIPAAEAAPKAKAARGS